MKTVNVTVAVQVLTILYTTNNNRGELYFKRIGISAHLSSILLLHIY
jgi:hypothetical protein